MNIVGPLLRLEDPSWLASRLARWSPLPLLFIVGYGFMAHGYAKIVKHPENFATILHALGVPLPHLMAWATIVIEFRHGFAIFVGAFVPVVTAPMIVVLLVATFTVPRPSSQDQIRPRGANRAVVDQAMCICFNTPGN